MKTTIKKWGINGEGIAFHEGKPVFIENAIPEEVIEFDIKSDEDTYLIGRTEFKASLSFMSDLERVWWMCLDAREISGSM